MCFTIMRLGWPLLPRANVVLEELSGVACAYNPNAPASSQTHCKFKASLSYVRKPVSKNKNCVPDILVSVVTQGKETEGT